MIKLLMLTFLTINIMNIKAARILAVFPTAALSHQIYFRALTKTLVNNGHELVIVTPNPRLKNEVPENVTEIDVSYVYKYWTSNIVGKTGGKSTYVEKRLKAAFHGFTDIFDMILQSEDMKKLIGQNFDLLVIENWVRQAVSLSHFFKVPVIRTSSYGIHFDSWKVLGAPVHPVLYQTSFPQRSYNLTLSEIIDKLLYYYKVDVYFDHLEDLENRMLRKNFGHNFPTLGDLSVNIDCIFINVHRIWEANRPMPFNAVYINGLHREPIRELPQDLKAYLDSAKNGVIYVSFGTTIFVSVLPDDKIKIMIDVLASLPYSVLWKWDEDTMFDKPDNFKVAKWFPQANLLRHPNVKLFINQVGLQSITEGIEAGVPIIGLPMLGDQWLNAENCVRHGIGLKLDMETMTADEFRNAVSQVSTNSFKKNIAKLRTLLQDQPMSGAERVAWWTAHLLRHGGRHFRSPAASLSPLEYYEMPLVLTVLAATVVFIILLIWTTCLVVDILKIAINKRLSRSG